MHKNNRMVHVFSIGLCFSYNAFVHAQDAVLSFVVPKTKITKNKSANNAALTGCFNSHYLPSTAVCNLLALKAGGNPRTISITNNGVTTANNLNCSGSLPSGTTIATTTPITCTTLHYNPLKHVSLKLLQVQRQVQLPVIYLQHLLL